MGDQELHRAMTEPRILILGKNGQLGWALQRALAIYGEVVAIDRAACDLAEPDCIRTVIRSFMPAVVVNAAAYTAVDRAESESERARQVNAIAPAILAEEINKIGSLLIHYSTDYVFNGNKEKPYVEEDEPDPLNVYGQSKLAGERAIQEQGGYYLIFRTSWVYGISGKNFPKTILALAKERDNLQVVADQIGAPTSVDLIADVTAYCLDRWLASPSILKGRSSIYHLTAAGETSWHGLACDLVRLARAAGLPIRLTPEAIQPISATVYPAAARRPRNSRLACEKLVGALGVRLPPWQFHIERLVSEIGSVRT